jgi:uncharacterized cupredoxin-like copper-binding protein
MGLATMAVASVLSSIGSAASAYGSIKQAHEIKKTSEKAEAKENAELEKQKKKQNDLNATYAGMQSNLYSGDVNGVQTNKFVQ